MTIRGIVAVESSLGMGYLGHMPWPRNQSDMDWFRDQTTGGVLVMGRKTWESIGSRNLPGRISAVFSRGVPPGPDSPHWTLSGEVSRELRHLQATYEDRSLWVIGGPELLLTALPLMSELLLTRIPGSYECDVFLDKRVLDEFSVVESFLVANDDTRFEVRKKRKA